MKDQVFRSETVLPRPRVRRDVARIFEHRARALGQVLAAEERR